MSEDISVEELRLRLGEDGLTLLDVRSATEFEGDFAAPCDPRHGHIQGARNLPLEELLECVSAADVRALVGLPEGVEIVAYCHVGNRSGFAVEVLSARATTRGTTWARGTSGLATLTFRASPRVSGLRSDVEERGAGYNARNYVGSWHEWSRDPALPSEP